MLHAGYLEKTILGLPQSSVEAVGWAGERLFSAGHTGELIEWDLHTLLVKQSVLLTGNAAWCLAVNRAEDHIAVGTEEGHLNIFQVDEYGLNYVKIFDKQDGRILCCRFDHTGNVLVTGSVDCLRIWDVKTGHAIHRMATGRAEANRETYVWSLAVLRDLSIIAGDSRGRITIWDGKLGSQTESFAALRADVLSVAVNDDETVFCCSGIDPIIKMYMLTPVKRDQQITNTWIKYIQRAVHDHDIKALAFGPAGRVYSGGIDGYLGVSVSARSKQTLLKYGPFLPQPCAVVAPEPRLLLLKYFNYVEVWRLGTPTDAVQLCDEAEERGKYLGLERGLEKLVELRAVRDQPVVSAALSPDGRWLAYTTETAMRLFQLRTTVDGGVPELKRVRELPAEFGAALHVRFAGDSREVLVVKRSGVVEVFGLRDEETDADVVELRGQVDTRKVVRGTISMLTVSACGGWLVVVGTCGTIAVWRRKRRAGVYGEWKHFLNLPKYQLAPTAIALHAGKPLLVAAFSDAKVSVVWCANSCRSQGFLLQFTIIAVCLRIPARSSNTTWRKCASPARPTRRTSRTRTRTPSTTSSSIRTTRTSSCCTTTPSCTCWKSASRTPTKRPTRAPKQPAWTSAAATAVRTMSRRWPICD